MYDDPIFTYTGSIRGFSQGLALAELGYEGKARYGYIDGSGRTVIAPCFDALGGSFREGLACGSNGNKYGYIDHQGNTVIDFQFDYPTSGFSEGRARVTINGQQGVIDQRGEFVIPLGPAGVSPFVGGTAATGLPDGQGALIDRQGKIVKSGFKSIHTCSEGLHSASQHGGLSDCGYINTTGEFVIEPNFMGVGYFQEGLAAVAICKDDPYGYIDKSGAYVIEPRFANARGFSEGLAAIVLDMTADIEEQKWGYINRAGEVVIAPQFDEAGQFHEGKALVMNIGEDGNDTRYQYIDCQGSYAFPTVFENADRFHEGFARVHDGYINHQGDYIWRR